MAEEHQDSSEFMMEDNDEFLWNNWNGLSAEDVQTLTIAALPAINTLPGGPCPRFPFHEDRTGIPEQGGEQMWDEDQLLPLTSILSIMYSALPPDADVQSGVGNMVQQATSDFIHLVTCQARERCRQQARHKMKGDDIIWALDRLGFTNFIPDNMASPSTRRASSRNGLDAQDNSTSAVLALPASPEINSPQEQADFT